MADSEYVYGIFKEETKNRFLCQVSIDGKDVECYIPSSCRLSNFIDLKGKTVVLKATKAKNARTEYAIYAVKTGREVVFLNLSETNRIVEKSIHSRRFAFLGPRKRVFREYTINGYKSDIFIDDTKTIIEIKSVLSWGNEALFPTIYSERCIKQLSQLFSLQNMGYKVCYLFISLNDSVKSIVLNKSVEEYSSLFDRCLRMGMTCQGFSLKLKNLTPIISSPVKVNVS